MVFLKIGNNIAENNIFNNILELNEIILPFEWHSFCISFNLVQNIMKLYHNDHIQAVQNFTSSLIGNKGISKLTTIGHLGGQKFVGFVADFQIFGTSLSEEVIIRWTSCQTQVNL